MEFTVGGKKVIVKDTITLQDGYDLYGLMMDQNPKDLRTQVPLMARMIGSWELDGDPSDAETYKELDLFKEFLPISRKIIPYVRELLVSGVKDETEQESLKN